MSKVSLYNLKRGQRFTLVELPHEGEMEFIKMDGMYGQVKHTDPRKHKELCAAYDRSSSFFCLSCGTPVKVVNDNQDNQLQP